jgi:hypothetical protein
MQTIISERAVTKSKSEGIEGSRVCTLQSKDQ